MVSCECLILGGGPAGSACAWALARAGVDVLIIDKCTFPREKVCGGWITPQIVRELDLDVPAYAQGRILQPITGFRVGCIDGRITDTNCGEVVSYGIRRFEFDDYLLKRSGARLLQGVPFRSLERSRDGWIINGEIYARMLIGAGGHFCPIARHFNPSLTGEVIVAAQELEFPMTPAQRSACAIRGEVPELYFCRDLRGYGWCFRKGDYLNVGLGRLDSHQLRRHVANFLDYLRRARRLSFDLPGKLLGHAYLLHSKTRRKLVDGSLLLIGDAAGVAYAQSGEGIRPAIESGLLAAQAILEANGNYSAEHLDTYRTRLSERFGQENEWSTRIGRRLPPRVMSALGRMLLATPWFSRRVVMENWFLHSTEPALEVPAAPAVSPKRELCTSRLQSAAENRGKLCGSRL